LIVLSLKYEIAQSFQRRATATRQRRGTERHPVICGGEITIAQGE
jgi:hypothetical protein